MSRSTFCKANKDYLRGFKIKLYPTEEQKLILNKQISLFRFVYNWALEVEHSNYHNNGSHFLRHREMYDKLKEFRNTPGNEWLKELPLNSARHAVISLINAFLCFFERNCKYPRFKSRKHSNKYFIVRGERVRFKGDYVHIEGFKRGDYILIKKPPIPRYDNMKKYNCVIKFDGIDYWLSFTTELYDPMEFNEPTTEGIGIDLGLRKLAQLSNGKSYKLPDTEKLQRRKKRQQRKVSKDIRRRLEEAKQTRTKFEDVQPSKSMIKRAQKYRKICTKITNINRTFIHGMTSEIVSTNPEFIVVETLNVVGMLKNKYLAKNISAASFGTISYQLKYKAKRKGIPFVKAPIDFASTKICSNCGNRYDVKRSEVYKCPVCGLTIDRDLNAAINLRNYFYST